MGKRESNIFIMGKMMELLFVHFKQKTKQYLQIRWPEPFLNHLGCLFIVFYLIPVLINVVHLGIAVNSDSSHLGRQTKVAFKTHL